MPPRIRNITGNPVSGHDFHGRHAELKTLRRTIENGNHVLLLAPRRVGKSSVVAETKRLLTEDGWKVVSVDVQHAEDEVCKSDLPWVLCGSIGLDTFVQNHGLEGSINDLTEMSIGAFNTEDAAGHDGRSHSIGDSDPFSGV